MNMSEYYDHYQRWEPLAEFHFNINSDDEDFDEENYLYCLCSRAYLRDGIKKYYVDKEEGSESDLEVPRDTQSQEADDHSHVHFSLDTSYKVKCEKDEGASCYCSASHTDNCCSTDEHDAQMHATSHALQPSDSGADLTYQDCHSDYTNNDKLEHMDRDSPVQETNENYLSEDTFEKFWAINGERLIWASWIKKYSDYINPAYLNEKNDILLDDNNIPKQRSVDQIYKDCEHRDSDDDIRVRKFSYDSKVNPYKKRQNQNDTIKQEPLSKNKDETWLPCARRRSCSEHERIVSPRTFAGTDSMTNVTKITLSSYDVTSSHVTSESSPSIEDYSVSSSNSDDQSNDQTRIANVENTEPTSVDDMDTDQYWQFLWKKHFGEQYALHYANFIDIHSQGLDLPLIDIQSIEESSLDKADIQIIQAKVIDIECENSEGNSQELPTVIEVQTQVEVMKLDEPITKTEKKERQKTYKYINSVGVLLQNLLNEGNRNNQSNLNEVTEAGDEHNDKKENEPIAEQTTESYDNIKIVQSVSNTNFTSYSYDDGDDDPPEDTPVSLKRSHEIDYEEGGNEKIKATFEVMGFAVQDHHIPKGQMVFRKRLTRLRPPRSYKKFGSAKKTYFDEDGNPLQCDNDQFQNKDSQDEREMQADNGCPDFISEARKLLESISQNSISSETNYTNESKDITDHNQSTTQNVDFVKNSDAVNLDTQNNTSIDDINTDIIYDVNKIVTKSESMNIDVNSNADDKNIVSDSKFNDSDIKEASLNNSKYNKSDESDNVQNDLNTRPEESNSYDVQNKVGNSMNEVNSAVEASNIPFPDDLDQSSDNQFNDEKIDSVESPVVTIVQPPKRRRRQKRQTKVDEGELSFNIPEELKDDPKMMKYWKKRHSLFHRFDEGVRMDRESWFSVTPENVARHIARKYTYDTVLDAFCGAGGNTIQFAFTTKKVIAIDIDPLKIEIAKHNAAVYGVAERIEFIVGDFFELAPTLKADMVFLSPPWGGPGYSNNTQYDIETMLLPKPASELMSVARIISPAISLYLPRNTRLDQILCLAKEVGGSVEVEQSYLDRRFVAITAYFY